MDLSMSNEQFPLPRADQIGQIRKYYQNALKWRGNNKARTVAIVQSSRFTKQTQLEELINIYCHQAAVLKEIRDIQLEALNTKVINEGHEDPRRHTTTIFNIQDNNQSISYPSRFDNNPSVQRTTSQNGPLQPIQKDNNEFVNQRPTFKTRF